MKNFLFLIAFLFTTALSFAQDVYVQGYTRSNGTYVQGYYRTTPNSAKTTYIDYDKPTYIDYTPTYTPPVTTYSTPSYSSSQTIYTGPRGGQYYINSNGNKSYVRN